MAEELVVDFAPFFRRLELVRLPGRSAHRTGKDRHHPAFQLHRRQHIALARNRLLSAALGLLGAQAATVNWVLWMDVDVRHIPRDLIRHLLAANRTIVVPNCLWRMNNGQVSYATALLLLSVLMTIVLFTASSLSSLFGFSRLYLSNGRAFGMAVVRLSSVCHGCIVGIRC